MTPQVVSTTCSFFVSTSTELRWIQKKSRLSSGSINVFSHVHTANPVNSNLIDLFYLTTKKIFRLPFEGLSLPKSGFGYHSRDHIAFLIIFKIEYLSIINDRVIDRAFSCQ